MATISTNNLYLNPMWSDITIKYGDTSIPGHKIVLGQRSKCFARFLEFEEGAERSDALEAMIRYMYTFQYIQHNTPRRNDWRLYLEIADAAEKYELPELKRRAIDELSTAKFANPSTVADILLAIPAYCANDGDKLLGKCEKQLKNDHFLSLLQVPTYTDTLGDEQRSLHMMQLAAALVDIRSYVTDHYGNSRGGLSVDRLDSILKKARAKTLPELSLPLEHVDK
ncbi:hypothetical protein LTR17_014335 [Elasticomyces elasticus]|nr:hypothetical protein LTR17_014335 [Elasticomyces elasticus]